MMRNTVAYGYSEKYRGLNGANYFGRQSKNGEIGAAINLAKFARYIGKKDTVLEFGCGGGYNLSKIRCANRIGVEINPYAIRVARRKGINVVSNMKAIGDGLVDVAISHHSLEHIPYPLEALRIIRKKIRKGGLLILYVPLDDWRVQKRYIRDDKDNHIYTWTPLLLGNLLHEAGFTNIKDSDIRIVTHAWPPFVSVLYSYLPTMIFNVVCSLWSIMRKRRQLAVAVRKH